MEVKNPPIIPPADGDASPGDGGTWEDVAEDDPILTPDGDDEEPSSEEAPVKVKLLASLELPIWHLKVLMKIHSFCCLDRKYLRIFSRLFSFEKWKISVILNLQIILQIPKKKIIKAEVVGDKKEHVNVVFIGHVDAGKSTIGGQIMALTGMVDKRTLEKYEREAREKSRESWYLSWALDTNQEGQCLKYK